MKDLKYFNTISDFNNVKYDFSTPTISYVEEDKNVRYNSYDNVNTYFSIPFISDSLLIVNDQSKLEYCKILDTDELLPLTGSGELRYTTDEMKLWHIEMKFKDEVTNFNEMFNSVSITNVSENIFKNCTSAISFRGLFKNCSNIKNIPENLFKYNTKVTDFGQLFNACSIQNIPENLFKYNTEVTNFSYLFGSCNLIKSIPENLFKYNTKVQDFSFLFNNCTGITSIPNNLFINNISATNFMRTFNSCSGLNGTVPVDSDSTPIYKRSTPGKEGYAIVTSHDNCFFNCTGLTDYDSIPTDWK